MSACAIYGSAPRHVSGSGLTAYVGVTTRDVRAYFQGLRSDLGVGLLWLRRQVLLTDRTRFTMGKL
jgi:hypothetical protein